MWIVIPEEPFDMSFTEKETNFSENFGSSFSEGINPGSQSVFDEAKKAAEEVKMSSSSSNGRVIVGAIFILIGLLFLSEKIFSIFRF